MTSDETLISFRLSFRLPHKELSWRKIFTMTSLRVFYLEHPSSIDSSFTTHLKKPRNSAEISTSHLKLSLSQKHRNTHRNLLVGLEYDYFTFIIALRHLLVFLNVGSVVLISLHRLVTIKLHLRPYSTDFRATIMFSDDANFSTELGSTTQASIGSKKRCSVKI